MSILLIDNYDSFTYNVVHSLHQLGVDITVKRNDKITVKEASSFNSIIISPGPGIPRDAGIVPQLLTELAPKGKKILGICLGHQAIGENFGAKLVNLPKVYHGLQTDISIQSDNDTLFKDLPSTIKVGRYHSWAIAINDFPSDQLKITAVDAEGHIMALQHKKLPIYGVQFHPESILTPDGNTILDNWLKI